MAATTTRPARPPLRPAAPATRIRRAVGHWCAAVLHGARDHLPAHPDRGDDPVQLQRLRRHGKFNYRGTRSPSTRWLHPFDWPGLPDAIRTACSIAVLVDDRLDDPGHAHRPGPDPLPVPRPGRHQRPDLPADGHARDRHGREPADAVRGDRPLPPLKGVVPRRSSRSGFITILIAHIMFNISYVVVTVKARLVGLRPAARGGGDGPRGQRVGDVLEGDLPAHLPGHHGRRRCSPSACRSTTSSSPTSCPGTTNTFPIWIYTLQKNALPVQINVIGSIIFLGAVAFVAISTIIQGRRARAG